MPKATTSKQTDTPGRTKVGDWLGTQLGTVLVPSSSAYVPSQTTGEQVAKKKTRTPKKTPKSKETIENEPGDEEYFSSTQYQSILFDLTNETEVAPAPVTLRDPAFLGYCYFQPLLDEGWGGPEGTTLVKAATGRPLSVAGAKGLWNQIGPNNLKRDLPEFSLAIAVPKGLIKESCLKQDLASGEQWDTAEFDEAFQGERVIHFISGQHRIWCLKRYIGPLLLDAWEKTRAYKAAFEKDGVAKIPEDKQANYDMLRKRMLSPKHTWLVRVYDYTNLMGTDDGAVRMLGLTHNNVTAAQVDAPVWQLRNAAVTKNLTPKEPAAMLKFFTGVGDKSSNLVQALIQRHSDVLEFMCELQPHRHFDLMTKTTPKKLGEMTLNGSWGVRGL
ncbi:hypothetical protein C8R43DRAFT_974825 [Mycena crocata]|nr:hypothetical protein C8R43DRAFT_1048783 [Mycena crocata]KAJ7177585.1 hypothetical protein C8R43DRAFT_974825 [Mycena crocata]